MFCRPEQAGHSTLQHRGQDNMRRASTATNTATQHVCVKKQIIYIFTYCLYKLVAYGFLVTPKREDITDRNEFIFINIHYKTQV